MVTHQTSPKSVVIGGLMVSALLSLGTVGFLIVDAVNFHSRDIETSIPMSIALPFFAFPLYVGNIFLTFQLTKDRPRFRKALRWLSLSPYAVALLIGLTAR